MIVEVLPLLVVLAVQAPPAQQAPPAPAQRVAPAPRKVYNETADAGTQVTSAVSAIKADNTRVLVLWGANDDERCTAFERALTGGADPKKMRDLFADEYRVVHVDVGHLDRNQDLAKAYGAALTADRLPHLTILDASGKVVAQQSSAAFAAATGAAARFDPDRLLTFLTAHKAPPPPPAGPLFRAALQQGKREGKTVFVWFSAPW